MLQVQHGCSKLQSKLTAAVRTHQNFWPQASICNCTEHLLLIFSAEQTSCAAEDSSQSMIFLHPQTFVNISSGEQSVANCASLERACLARGGVAASVDKVGHGARNLRNLDTVCCGLHKECHFGVGAAKKLTPLCCKKLDLLPAIYSLQNRQQSRFGILQQLLNVEFERHDQSRRPQQLSVLTGKQAASVRYSKPMKDSVLSAELRACSAHCGYGVSVVTGQQRSLGICRETLCTLQLLPRCKYAVY